MMDESDVNSDFEYVQLPDYDADTIGVNISKSNLRSEIELFPVESDFYGYELLLLLRFQSDSELFLSWIERYDRQKNSLDCDVADMPHTLWYLAVMLDKKRDRLLQFIRNESTRFDEGTVSSLLGRSTLLQRYLDGYRFTELHLDGIFKYGDNNTLPSEIFHCASVRWLSLKYNYLDRIPADIGRMTNLEYLSLTNNKLQNRSLPYTLVFCRRLQTLMLDNNLLDALPGFLLDMPSLTTVHRHGNHNYFKSTFMWYHTDVNERILVVWGTNDFFPREPETLQFWAAKALIGLKLDFFADHRVAAPLKDYISLIYSMFNVCGHCCTARLSNEKGYKVITFKNPYLGNTCVPFQHWACSLRCAQAIEVPARQEQITAASKQDSQYDTYVNDCQLQYDVCTSKSRLRRNLRQLTQTNRPTQSCLGCLEGRERGCSCSIS